MQKEFFQFGFIILILSGLLFSACQKDSDNLNEEDILNVDEFSFFPKVPTSDEETSIIFYSCSYYVTTSIISEKQNIDIKKHFNSQMKWPCVLSYDTISLGKLTKGNYKIKLEIIDLNPNITDSVFYTNSQTLAITR